MIHPLSGSVGTGGQNAQQDVSEVQKLLIACNALTGAIDGQCDARTIAAIVRVQGAILRRPDGRIDPGGATWAWLVEREGDPNAPDLELARRPERQPERTIDERSLTRWVTRDGKEVRFATLEGLPPPPHWTHRPLQRAVPGGAHPVPVLAPYPTPTVPGGFDPVSRERVRYLDALRTILRRAGLDWDARVLMPLWANETDWGRHAYGNNIGNIKAEGTVYSPSFQHLLQTHTVHVEVPESVAVMVFTDRVRSIDGYHAFNTPEEFARYSERLFRRRPGAIEALRAGGLEGAEAFARALQGGPRPYSPASVDAAVQMFRGCYRASLRFIGEERYLP